MRYAIWKKEDFFEVSPELIRIDMDPSVVELGEDLSVSYRFNHNDPPLGKVTDVRLEDGEISGEVEFFDPTWDDETMEQLKCRLGGYYSKVMKNDEGNVILSAKLLGVSIVPEWDIPGNRPKE